MNQEIRQLTKDEAIAMAESKWWEKANHASIAAFQIMQDKLCCPFSIFHEAVEKALGRPVYTHEFGLNRAGLIEEMRGLREPPSLDDIIAMIPEEKRIVMKFT
jgi:hypothetical protein